MLKGTLTAGPLAGARGYLNRMAGVFSDRVARVCGLPPAVVRERDL